MMSRKENLKAALVALVVAFGIGAVMQYGDAIVSMLENKA
jgi:hypothetical protein